MAKFNFPESDKFRDKKERELRKSITNLYTDAYKQVKDETKTLEKSIGNNTPSKNDFVSFQNNVSNIYTKVSVNTTQITISGMVDTAIKVNNENNEFLDKIHIPNTRYGVINVPSEVVSSIVTGNIYSDTQVVYNAYKNGWNMSSSIWGSNQKILQDIATIISNGVSQGQSVYEIAKQLEDYANPAKRTLSFIPGTNRVIDYNAQRLVRTMVNHAYQAMLKKVGEHNPFVELYQWHSAFAHGRTCQMCMDMDGNFYSKDGKGKYPEMPLDHPNGLCYFTYEIEPIDNIIEKMDAWVDAPDGTYPEIDDYINYLKYGEI